MRLVRNFCLSNFGLLRGKTFLPDQRCATSLQHSTVQLLFRKESSPFSPTFYSQEGPQVPEIVVSNRLDKMDLNEARPKIGNISPPNTRFRNPAWNLFSRETFKNMFPSWISESSIWGMKCCRFSGAPHLSPFYPISI